MAADEVLRVLRGGSFLYRERYLRAAFRDTNFADDRMGDIGFRVVFARLHR